MSTWSEETPEAEVYDAATFASGTQKRLPVVLLLDTSESMLGGKRATGPRPIDELNDALQAWSHQLRSSPRLMHRVELAIVTFGKGGVTIQPGSANGPFRAAGEFEAPTLEAGDVTPMLEAIQIGIELSEQRKAELDAVRPGSRFRPLIFMITDGAPTDGSGKVLDDSALQPLANELADLEARKKLAFFPVGVMGARIDALRILSRDGYWDLRRGNFSDFLKTASISMGADDPITSMRAQIAKARTA